MKTPSNQRIPARKLEAPSATGLIRARVVERLRTSAARPVVLLLASAGAGKTTALAHVVSTGPSHHRWLSLDRSDRTGLVGALASALTDLITEPVDDIDDLLVQLERAEQAVTLVLDDIHELGGESSDQLDRLIRYRPQLLHIIMAGRSSPLGDIDKLVLSEAVEVVDFEALRFRWWEVDELFRHQYHEPLDVTEVRQLTERTDGWVAGLQLFHLATRERGSGDRQRLIAELTARHRPAARYLARSVLDQLDDEHRDFLVATSVFDVMTGARCDSLLSRTGSHELLVASEEQGIFTTVVERGFRYHDVFRSLLLELLAQASGAAGTRSMHRLAGTILEAEGATPEAMGAFARAEEWAEVTRLLREGGVNGQDTVARWLDTIPEHIALNDPWVRRGLARRLTVDGAFSHALSIYHDLKRQALDLRSDADLPEARLLESWTAPNVGRTVSWVDLLRAAIAGRPGEVADAAVPSGPVEQLATIGALLLAGRVGEAQDSLGRLVDAHGPVAEAVAVALEVCADILRDLDDPGDGIGVAARLAADANLPMLERLVGSLNALIGHPESAAVAAAMADEAGDEWGGALARLFGGLGSLLSGNPDPATLEKSAATFGALGASTLQCWADVLRELSSEAGAVLPGFEGIAKGTGPTLHALALVQLARTSERPVVLLDQAIAIANAAGTGFLVDSAARRCIEGFRTPPGSPTVDDAGAVGVPRLDVTWVGPLSLRLDGRPVDLTALRPIHRSLLKLIVVRAGAWVHREVLIEELWPERPPEQGFRNLQVGISAIRRMLEPSAPRGDSHLLERDGERYRLVIASFDLRTLEERVEHFDRSTRAGDDEGARVARAAIAELLHDEPLADADYLDTLETERNRLSMLTERIRSTG